MEVAVRSLQRLVPAWVEPDPLRGRAVDALGLQATADAIADELLPGLSVLTIRARYFSMIAWARGACAKQVDENLIHRLEVALAVREASLHPRDGVGERCRFVGSRHFGRGPQPPPSDPPGDPSDVFRTPVWRGYRASMQSLGFLDDSYALTDEGAELAKSFAAACGKPDSTGKTQLPASACLSRMSGREAALLEVQLGFPKKRKLSEDRLPAARRLALHRELSKFTGDNLLPLVLAYYENQSGRSPTPTAAVLREAAVWERLSIGLNAIFLLWLRGLENPGRTEKMIARARKNRSGKRPFAEISIGDNTAADAIQSVRRALYARGRLPQDDLPRCDSSAFQLGEALIGTTPLDEVFDLLERRHIDAKGEEGWIRRVDSARELARDADDTWELPRKATLHGYRLKAFDQIRTDLQRARRRSA
jgi:hypothetical protein